MYIYTYVYAYIYIYINVSVYNANMTQDLLDSKMDKRRKGMHVSIYIDIYGTFIRQLEIICMYMSMILIHCIYFNSDSYLLILAYIHTLLWCRCFRTGSWEEVLRVCGWFEYAQEGGVWRAATYWIIEAMVWSGKYEYIYVYVYMYTHVCLFVYVCLC
jgi:hypothetical protein